MKIKVKIKWKYKEKSGTCFDEFGFPEFNPSNQKDIGGLMFWYEEGNGSCDCNRSIICGLSEKSWPCAEEIEFLSIKPILTEQANPGDLSG